MGGRVGAHWSERFACLKKGGGREGGWEGGWERIGLSDLRVRKKGEVTTTRKAAHDEKQLQQQRERGRNTQTNYNNNIDKKKKKKKEQLKHKKPKERRRRRRRRRNGFENQDKNRGRSTFSRPINQPSNLFIEFSPFALYLCVPPPPSFPSSLVLTQST